MTFLTIYTGSRYLRFYIEPSAKNLAYANKINVEHCGKGRKYTCYSAFLIYQVNGQVFTSEKTDLTYQQADILRQQQGIKVTYLINQPSIIIHEGYSDKQFFWFFLSIILLCLFTPIVYFYRKWKKPPSNITDTST
ncbi:hypothetical protein ACFFHT_06550 [Gallibacterium melopsittaci]|uniref:DUF3592 domain-containing protein n=1 Tax=Gallibacterium melopsittaci TaxID=516063 RepID=A0ABV6HX54_9PAST